MKQNRLSNFAFFGTPTVARDTLAILLKHGFRPTIVVTNPDKPRGRGLTISPSPVKELAEEHHIPTITPNSLKENILDTIHACNAEYAIVVAYGKIFPESLITVFPKGVFNIHYSLLPRYRGASPVETALRSGETVIGVSIQKMVYELDAGDIFAAQSITIHKEETARELLPRLVQLGAELLVRTLPLIFSGALHGVKQDSTLATHTRKIKKEDGLLSLTGDALENWRAYRAYIKWPGVYFFAMRDKKRIRVKITCATYTENTFTVQKVIPEGKRAQPYNVFLAAGWKPKD